MKKKFDEEFENKEVTISRKDFGEAVAQVVVRCEMMAIAAAESPADIMKVELLKVMLAHFSADLMAELFGNEETDKLEVE